MLLGGISCRAAWEVGGIEGDGKGEVWAEIGCMALFVSIIKLAVSRHSNIVLQSNHIAALCVYFGTL